MLPRLALVLLFAFAALGQSDPDPNFHERCDGFAVSFASKSGDAYSDDMTVTISFGEKELQVPIDLDLYLPRGPLTKIPNRCSELTAIDIGADRVLLLFAKTGRPQFDGLVAVLLDTKQQRIVDVEHKFGDIRTEKLIVRRAAPDAIDVRLIYEQLADAQCDCADAAIEEWQRISATNDKLTGKWMK